MLNSLSVLHFRSSNFVGGPEKQILTHVKNLGKQKGYSVFVASFNEPGGKTLCATAEESGAKTLLLDPSMVKLLSNVRKLVNYIRDNNVDIVCCHDYKTELYAFFLNKLYGIKTIGFSRGATAENAKMRFYSWLDFLLIRFNSQLVAVSNAQQGILLAKGLNPSKISVVENAVTDPNLTQAEGDIENIRETLNITSNSLVIFSAGRLSEEKGHRYLIEAVIALLTKKYDIHLVIAGDGILMSEFQALIADAKCQGRIHLLGHRSDMTNLYQAADIFVLPSLSEGLPNALLEAMINKLPAIGSNVGGIPEVVNDGVTGLLAEPASPHSLGEAIAKVVDDPVIMNNLAIAGEQSVINMFSPKVQTEKLIALYKKVVSL